MPTSLTTATAREDLIEAALYVATDDVMPGDKGEWFFNRARLQALAVVTARYLNTMRLHPDTGEEEHDELHKVTTELLNAAVALGGEACSKPWNTDGYVLDLMELLSTKAAAYMATMTKLHNPERLHLPARRPQRSAREVRDLMDRMKGIKL